MAKRKTFCEECENGKPLKGDVMRCMAVEKAGYNFTKKRFSTCRRFTPVKKEMKGI